MGVHDVVADADVHGHRHAGLPCGRSQAQLGVGRPLGVDRSADRFAESFAAGRGLPGQVVQPARFAP